MRFHRINISKSQHAWHVIETIHCYLIYFITLEQGLEGFFCKGPGNKYFRLCRPYTVSVVYSSVFEQSFKNVKTILSSKAVQKQAMAQVIPTGRSLSTPIPAGVLKLLHP